MRLVNRTFIDLVAIENMASTGFSSNAAEGLKARYKYLDYLYIVLSRSSAVPAKRVIAVYKDNCLTASCGTTIEPADLCYDSYREAWEQRNDVFSNVCRRRLLIELETAKTHYKNIASTNDTKRQEILRSRVAEIELQLDNSKPKAEVDGFMFLHRSVVDLMSQISRRVSRRPREINEDTSSLTLLEGQLQYLSTFLTDIVKEFKPHLIQSGLDAPWGEEASKWSPGLSDDVDPPHCTEKSNNANVLSSPHSVSPSPNKKTNITNPYISLSGRKRDPPSPSHSHFGVACLSYHLQEHGVDSSRAIEHHDFIQREIDRSRLPPVDAYAHAFRFVVASERQRLNSDKDK